MLLWEEPQWSLADGNHEIPVEVGSAHTDVETYSCLFGIIKSLGSLELGMACAYVFVYVCVQPDRVDEHLNG